MLHCSPCSICAMANLMCCGDRDRVSGGVDVVGVAMFVVVELVDINTHTKSGFGRMFVYWQKNSR